ncbi:MULTISPECIES: energy-coupling factor transporter transmembrane component T family protein [Mycolicibacterium]|uniref:energy-coupling factor transporter transmembrane component T family protein n=1 Tax=Mycolicibacterium TaxID=1866885 RepID=UPI001BD189E6|nr:energy-coupling factor transporter transmembrane protein EcfT [Mycolicibacterium neoaurum]QVI30070.1 energy-coupling factor transporter transmembrane protein EcfT [Mycolicibacterium neoaurum]
MSEQKRPLVLLRPVPGDTVIHRLWAGTKLIGVVALAVLMVLYPGWIPIAMITALLAVAILLARVPRGALPSIPGWIWLLILLGGVTAAFAGGTPIVTLGGLELELGGLLKFLRVTAVSIVLLGMGLLVSWTTNVAEIAPAVSTLGRPLRWLRLPIDDWAATVALSLRAFPMLIDEFRILYAARRLRPRELPDGRRERMKAQVSDLIDLLAATVTVSLRRADEMGDAITARGGAGQLSAHPSRLHTADVVALIVLALVCGVAGYIEGFTFLATT